MSTPTSSKQPQHHYEKSCSPDQSELNLDKGMESVLTEGAWGTAAASAATVIAIGGLAYALYNNADWQAYDSMAESAKASAASMMSTSFADIHPIDAVKESAASMMSMSFSDYHPMQAVKESATTMISSIMPYEAMNRVQDSAQSAVSSITPWLNVTTAQLGMSLYGFCRPTAAPKVVGNQMTQNGEDCRDNAEDGQAVEQE
ncbi:MAG: hypothetical protein TREMPRED_005343 [Tremellales sp. Tagirdzhanova-0007]|nr:MAG: hypothetical protein TREMPRED_005343 [Tremellales sp. Tagirdzhanova-0007]